VSRAIHYVNKLRKYKTGLNGSHHMPTTKSTLFVESKDEWDTKEGTGISMKNALHV